MSKLSPELLEILVCPKTKGKLEYDEKNNKLISKDAGLVYSVKDGIPILLIDEASKL